MERVVSRVNRTLAAFASGIAMTGDIRVDMMALLTHSGCEKTISHSLCVANEAQRLAARWNESLFEAEVAGWLHDISGIGCHTTLRADATGLDKVVFLADKIRWDQPGDPPYLQEMIEALDRSLDCGACVYLGYLMRRRHELPIVHPWVEDACRQLCSDSPR
jgi:HD superfamily phosphohydrolase YqeK